MGQYTLIVEFSDFLRFLCNIPSFSLRDAHQRGAILPLDGATTRGNLILVDVQLGADWPIRFVPYRMAYRLLLAEH